MSVAEQHIGKLVVPVGDALLAGSRSIRHVGLGGIFIRPGIDRQYQPGRMAHKGKFIPLITVPVTVVIHTEISSVFIRAAMVSVSLAGGTVEVKMLILAV